MIDVKKFKIGTYAIYKGLILRFFNKSKGLVLQGAKSNDLIALGFNQYTHPELSDKLFKNVSKDKLESVFSSIVYCKYKGLKFTLDGAFNEDDQTYRIWPVFESFDKLELNHKDDNTHYWIKEEELDEIWEEREKVSGFEFKVKNVNYIKNESSV